MSGIWDRDRQWDMRTTGSTGVPIATGLRCRVSGLRSQVSGIRDGIRKTEDGTSHGRMDTHGVPWRVPVDPAITRHPGCADTGHPTPGTGDLRPETRHPRPDPGVDRTIRIPVNPAHPPSRCPPRSRTVFRLPDGCVPVKMRRGIHIPVNGRCVHLDIGHTVNEQPLEVPHTVSMHRWQRKPPPNDTMQQYRMAGTGTIVRAPEPCTRAVRTISLDETVDHVRRYGGKVDRPHENSAPVFRVNHPPPCEPQ